MKRLFPAPYLSLVLFGLWLMLTRFSLGYLILGTGLALIAGWAYTALHPATPRIRRWRTIPRLFVTLIVDVIRSNIQVTRLLLTEGRGTRKSAFIQIPLTVRDENALALLAIILTATPGTAWFDHDPDTGVLLLHVFDLREGADWSATIKTRYESLLLEIFQ